MIGYPSSGRQGQMSHDFGFFCGKALNPLIGEGGSVTTISFWSIVIALSRLVRQVRTKPQRRALRGLCAECLFVHNAVRCERAPCCVLHVRRRRARGETGRPVLHRLSGPECASTGCADRICTRWPGSRGGGVIERIVRTHCDVLHAPCSCGILRRVSAADCSAHVAQDDISGESSENTFNSNRYVCMSTNSL